MTLQPPQQVTKAAQRIILLEGMCGHRQCEHTCGDVELIPTEKGWVLMEEFWCGMPLRCPMQSLTMSVCRGIA